LFKAALERTIDNVLRSFACKETLSMKRQSRITVPQFVGMKQKGEKITMLTAYDYTTASLVDAAGVESVLVGDSMGMVVQGHETTLPVTFEQIKYHAEIVGRAVERALVIADLPFPTNHLGVHRVIELAGQLLKEARVQAVKLEGGADQADVIAGLTTAGIPVMAHVGLRPQNVHQMGGYKVQRDAERLLEDALAAQGAGAFGIVLEGIPAELAARLTKELTIPTIGIGAGAQCDGQVLVLHDMLGLTTGFVPRFVKQYANLGEQITAAVQSYCQEVRSGTFPAPEHEFK
jgi:3-methyl-2-oxobutanoate hydroxymethyltransferase